MNLLNIAKKSITNYFDKLLENNFIPLITLPTRIASKTLIDNILYTECKANIMSGNLTINMSDHMPQFSLFPRKKNLFSEKAQYLQTRV